MGLQNAGGDERRGIGIEGSPAREGRGESEKSSAGIKSGSNSFILGGGAAEHDAAGGFAAQLRFVPLRMPAAQPGHFH